MGDDLNYLETVAQDNGGFEEDIKNYRIMWRKALGILYNKN